MSIIDNLELAKRTDERRTDYKICYNCHGNGKAPPIFNHDGPCTVCNGTGYRVEKQGKA